MRIRKYILVLFLLQPAIAGQGQSSHINFTSLTSRDGFLSNSVNAILKDRYGLMWFATDDGLNKFDGTNFTVYRHRQSDSSSLRANEILALHEDRSGNLWVGTSGGAVSRYDRQLDRWVSYPGAEGAGGLYPNAVIRSICSDEEGKIWIAQFETLFVLEPSTHHFSKVLAAQAGGALNKMTFFCVFEDSRRRMWAGSDKGLFLYEKATHSFRQFRHDGRNAFSLMDDRVKALGEDKAGNLWVGTEGGLCMMLPDESGFVRYKPTGDKDAVLGGGAINAIAADKDGMLWIGTMEGLHVLDPRTGHSVGYMPEEGNIHSLTSKAIKSIYIDKEGIYWFGTYRGGINKYDKNLNLFNVKLGDAFHDNGTRTSIVTSFAERDKDHVWVGTDGGGLYDFDRKTERLGPVSLLSQGKAPVSLAVLALKVTRNRQLYIGTYGNGLIILDPVTGKVRHMMMGPGINDLSANDFYCIMEDGKGQVWLGTNGQGVNVLRDNKVIARFTPRPKGAGDVLLPVNGYIRAIEEDKEGDIWIGSYGSGLAIYRPSSGKFTVYGQNNSQLPNDKICALLSDSKGRIWIGTYGGGLSVFDKKSGQFTSFSEKDGLQNTSIYQVVEDARGRIWVSTNSGLSSYDAGARTFRNYTHYNGLQDNNFTRGAGIRSTDGELFFGGLQGFNYFNPADLTTNRNVPAVILTDLQVANKSVVPGKESPIREQISVAGKIQLSYKQNFALSFVALNYTLPKQNQYAYKLEGFDKDWNYTGSSNTAYYTNLDPGEYIFRVKACNNDGVWSSGDTSVRIFVRPPFWRTVYAYIFYVLAAGGLLLYSRHRGLSRLRRKFELERERQEVRRVQELDRMKLKFLTNLSHEFRTPISLIMGPVDQLLSEQRQAGRSPDKLQMIRRNARRLLNLVNQLLDFRKMEEQELKLQLSEGELVAFVKEIGHSFMDMSERKRIQFRFETDIGQMFALFDRDKIERILFNLLSNAFKFTLEGGKITLALHALDDPADAGICWVSIKVMDTGIGISPDKKAKIFDRFFQGASADAVLNQGSGIGLSITKEFVRMHGGSIDVESEPGRGSVFTVRLPLATVDAGASEEERKDEGEISTVGDGAMKGMVP
ncbi:MAG TPA: two-component regulator propeller domain-containing protein, partial [Puia sp.]|nr:two-component regulator propeller domain-containing protein [Puia sp.]